MGVHDEVGVGDDGLIAGVQEGLEGQQEVAGGARGDQKGGLGGIGLAGGAEVYIPSDLIAEVIGDSVAQRHDALGHGVAIGIVLDGLDGRLFEGVWDGKVGLADREIDGVFELGPEVEDPPDAGSVDLPGSFRDEAIDVHGGHDKGAGTALERKDARWARQYTKRCDKSHKTGRTPG